LINLYSVVFVGRQVRFIRASSLRVQWIGHRQRCFNLGKQEHRRERGQETK